MINIDIYFRSDKLQFTPILLNNLTHYSTDVNHKSIILNTLCYEFIYDISHFRYTLTVIFKFPSHNIDHIIFL